jgi:hypothetical protein
MEDVNTSEFAMKHLVTAAQALSVVMADPQRTEEEVQMFRTIYERAYRQYTNPFNVNKWEEATAESHKRLASINVPAQGPVNIESGTI